MHGVGFHRLAIHDIQRAGHAAAAGHGDGARQLFRPLIGDRLENDAVALFIRQGHGRGGHAADGEGDHLQFREGTPHSVAIDHGQSEACRRCDGQHGIDAAGFHGHRRVDLSPKIAFYHFKDALVFRAADALFAKNGRSAHHGDGHDQRIVRHLFGRNERHLAALAHRADRHQLSDIGVTATACAQQRRAQSDVLDLLNTKLSQCFHLIRGWLSWQRPRCSSSSSLWRERRKGSAIR